MMIDLDATEMTSFEYQRRLRQKRMAISFLVSLVVLALMLLWPLLASAADFDVTIVRPSTSFDVVIVKPAKPATTHQSVSGLHSHRCPHDGTVWWHGEDQFGNQKSHTCPKCGRVVWDIEQQAAKPKLMSILPQRQSSNCPGGVCPIPSRFMRR